MKNQENSPLILRIKKALENAGTNDVILRVSVANEPVWENGKNGARHLIRWMCWNLVRDGVEISSPDFTVLHDKVTKRQLEEELPTIFPLIKVVVDDDIEV